MSNPEIDKFGNKMWYNSDGAIHREDGPAIIWSFGEEEWYINGQLHRTDSPAVVNSDGTQEWCINDILYRDNKSYQEAANLSDEDMLMIKIKYGDVK